MSDKRTCHCVAEATEPVTKNPKKLYRLYSIIPRFEHRGCYYKDVQVTWCVANRNQPPIPYADGIKDYKPETDRNQYCEGALNEYFTRAEAEVFKSYVLYVYGDDTIRMEEIELPIDNDSYPTTGVALGGGIDIMDLSRDPSYCLGFKVGGLFDVRGDEPIE